MYDVSSKCYDRSEEVDKPKVILRGVRKEINSKRNGKKYTKYEVSYSRTFVVRLLLTILGLGLPGTCDLNPKTILQSHSPHTSLTSKRNLPPYIPKSGFSLTLTSWINQRGY